MPLALQEDKKTLRAGAIGDSHSECASRMVPSATVDPREWAWSCETRKVV